jgi:hypothetical protein
MQTVTTIGLDIAKSVFQIHGVDAAANVIVRRELKRRYVLPFFQKLPPCLVGIEACDSSHYRSRQLKALGHTVRLMPPAYVKRGGQNKSWAAPRLRLTHLFNSFAFSCTSSAVRRKNRAISANDIPRSSESFKKNRSALAHGSPTCGFSTFFLLSDRDILFMRPPPVSLSSVESRLSAPKRRN